MSNYQYEPPEAPLFEHHCENCGLGWQNGIEHGEELCSECAQMVQREDNEREMEEAKIAEAQAWMARMRALGEQAALIEKTMKRWKAYAILDAEMVARVAELVEMVKGVVEGKEKI